MFARSCGMLARCPDARARRCLRPGACAIVVRMSVPRHPLQASARASEAGDGIADSWITTKVKSTLLYSRNVGGTGIDVSTDNGIVTLSGKVHDGAERALAVKLAENVRGVRSVQSKALTF